MYESRRRTAAATFAFLFLFGACSPGGEVAPPSGRGIRSSPSPFEGEEGSGSRLRLRRLEIELKEVATGLEAPLYVTHAGGRSLFVVEQVGRIQIVRNGSVLSRPFLDIAERITAGGEQGLLGLAFHPGYAVNGRFFVNYTDTEGDTVVAEYSRTSATSADPTSERVLLRIDQPYANHNGGGLMFGPDGYLYIATGDGGSGGDPEGNGQDRNTLLGKLLRIDVDRTGGEAYGIPEDNPFRGRSDARPEIWSYGLRNPWRFSFDRTGIWIGDVGQGAWEEIDRMGIEDGGLNYGWNVMEGESCFEPPTDCSAEGLVLPIATYSHDLGSCSVTGGYVYRGGRFPKMVGAYLFGDYCSGLIWGLRAAGKSPQEPVLLLESGLSISSFGVNRNGEMLLTDLSSGRVMRVVAR